MRASTERSRRASGGSRQWRNSLHRSRPDCEMLTMVHNHDSGEAQMWWGPVLVVERGSLIHCFDGPFGVTLEWIDPPSPEPAQEH